jgi:nascent polypeptide-associated complex subunit alpha
MNQMMKRLGINQQEIDAEEVIIRTKDKEIIIKNPQVSKVNMMGQKTYQVVGKEVIRELSDEPDINEEDISTVMEQARVSREDAVNAIKESKGDLAEAIMNLTQS